MSDESYTKDWLIRQLADRAKFTIGDVRIIWDTFETILSEVIKNKKELIIPGLFKLYVKPIKAHKGWNAVKNEALEVPDSYRICFTASRALLDILREK